jgi:hypothetical protein
MAVVEPNILETETGLKYLPPEREAAWFGLLAAHAELTRALDGCLSEKHGLSLSAYEILSRLAHAEDGHLRMSDLAGRSQLSFSRVSRVVDALCQRELLAEAQDTFFETIEERFLGRLSCDEVNLLGAIFGRLVEIGPRRPPERLG